MLLIKDHKFNIPHYNPAPHFGTFDQAFLKEIENHSNSRVYVRLIFYNFFIFRFGELVFNSHSLYIYLLEF